MLFKVSFRIKALSTFFTNKRSYAIVLMRVNCEIGAVVVLVRTQRVSTAILLRLARVVILKVSC